MKRIDFLAIGDIVVDTFIKLKDAKVHCNLRNDECELCVRFGSKIPYEIANTFPAAGNSSNASICASRLGLNSALVTNLGNDLNGKNSIAILKKEKVKTKYIHKQKNKNTNHNYVLSYDNNRTILVKHNEFEYSLPKIKKVSWVYLSSLNEDSLEYHQEITNFLNQNPEIKLAFQPGTFQIKMEIEKLKDIYARTEIFFSNLEEAQIIAEMETKEILEIAKKIHQLGPKIVAISDGIRGAYLYYNEELWHLGIYPDKNPIVDSTGAGDAFSATITTALALGKEPLEAFTWGPINSASVIQKIGTQEGLLSRKQIEEYLKNAPTNYQPKKIN